MSRLLLCWCALLVVRLSAYASSWAPLDPEELRRTASPLDAEAGAEVLIRDVDVDNDLFNGATIRYHVRIRVYNERGLEKVSKIDLPYARGTRISGLEARTIKPDGTVLELNRKDVYDREVARIGSYRERVRSFAPPGIEPGVVVEYRYRHELNSILLLHVLAFQEDLPARHVRYRLRPLGIPGLTLRFVAFNCPINDSKPDKKGYLTFERRDLVAWKDEPYQAPPIHLRPSVVLYYRTDRPISPQHFWQDYAAELYGQIEQTKKPNRAVQSVVDSLIKPDDPDLEQVRKLHHYCRTEIQNRTRMAPPSGKSYPVNKGPADTLKHRSGWPSDINQLFIAMARAAGFDARPMVLNDRSFILFHPRVSDPFYLSDPAVAVRIGGEWSYCQPGYAPHLPFGMLPWQNTNTAGLIAAPTGGAIRTIVGLLPDASTWHREGAFTLDQDGLLEGSVTFTFTGNLAAARRSSAFNQTENERFESLRDELREALPMAEVSDFKIENLDELDDPLIFRFNLKVPEYAEQTGSRMFVQPSVFRKGTKPVFEANERNTDILFHFGFMERDIVTITHAEGLEVETGASPSKIDLSKLGEYYPTYRYNRPARQIFHRRDFTQNLVQVGKVAYEAVKAAYAGVHAADQHTFTLRRASDPGGTTSAAPGGDAAEPEAVVISSDPV
jgi:hypothetical protein